MSSPVHTTASAHLDDTGDARVEQTLALIKTLVGSLPPRDRHQFLRDIADAVRPLSAPRAGEVLGAIVHILPQRKLWSVADLKKQIDEQGVSASAKTQGARPPHRIRELHRGRRTNSDFRRFRGRDHP